MSIHITQVVSKNFKFFIFFILTSLLFSCAIKQSNYVSTKTAVELMSMQTKDFEEKKELVFASVISAFQDQGYKIKSADVASGFLAADGPTKESYSLWVGNIMDTLKATAHVEQMGSKLTKVRLNFVNEQKSSNDYGMEGGNDVPVEDPEFYQDIFSIISKAVYLRANLE